MPVNISSGTVEVPFDDVVIPGKVDLVWDRRYSTALLDRRPTLLGKGWTTRYLATLTPKAQSFEFVTPKGVTEFLADPAGVVQRGGRAINFGVYLEVFTQGERYIVQQWDVETGAVWRYCFAPGPVGQPWPLASIEDVTGQALDLVWDHSGKLTAILQRLEKRALLLSYTPSGCVTAVNLQVANGGQHVVVRYEYDDEGRLTAAYDAADSADRYEYDQNSRLTREIAKDGGVFTYRYDKQGRCIKTTGLDRYDEKRLRFLDATHVTEVTNSYDNTSHYQYLPSGQIVCEIDPLGGQRTTEYDEHGRILAKTDATGAVTHYTYDVYGNRATVTNACGNTHTFIYNEYHFPVSIIDPLGQEWHRAYDSANRLVSTVDPMGNRWIIRYDAEGNVAEITNPLGSRKHHKYTLGILNAVTDWRGSVTHFRHDAFGRVTERQGKLGEITSFHYDLLGNPIEASLPDRTCLRASYDNVGNMTGFMDGNSCSTYFRYGTCQRLLERIDPVGGKVRYLWGTEPGRLEQVINEKGETYRFFYDDAGRVIRQQSFDSAERYFQYDAEGYCIAYTNANGETISIQRDALHRVIGLTLPDGEHINYTFDPIGRLVAAGNSDGAVTFERDPLGRIVRETQGKHWVESCYDAIGNLIRTTTSLGHIVNYEVDDNTAVSKLTTLNNQTLEFKRNVYGQETSRYMPGGMVMEQRYDDLGRLIEQRIGLGRLGSGNGNTMAIPSHREIIRRAYIYDHNSSLKSMVDSRWGHVDYVYDPAKRLLQAIREKGPSESFSYDAARNLTQIQTRDKATTEEAFVYGPGNRLLQKGSTHYEYDAEGRHIKKIEAADSDEPKMWLYEWDALDRLMGVIRPDGKVWRYKYDALARRIGKDGLEKHRLIIWDKGRIIHESDEVQSLSTFIFNAHTFVPLATIQNARVYTIVNDHLGSPREMVDPVGSIVWSVDYKSWGGELTKQEDYSKTVNCPIRFQGQWHDQESGLHYSMFRYFDPEIGQFLSQDPIKLLGGWNLYAYVQNPINVVDPMGLNPQDIALGLTNPPIATPYGTFPQPDGLYNFARSAGATPYPGFDPQLGHRGATSVYLAMQDANTIHFNLDGFPSNPEQLGPIVQSGREGLPQNGNFTNWELATILDDPDLKAKAKWYRDGEEVDPPECGG